MNERPLIYQHPQAPDYFPLFCCAFAEMHADLLIDDFVRLSLQSTKGKRTTSQPSICSRNQRCRIRYRRYSPLFAGDKLQDI